MKRILFLLSICFFSLITTIQAQDPAFLNTEIIRAELDSRGFEDISIEEMRSRLTQKGIDVDNLDGSQTEALQNALDEIYAEINAEKEALVEPTQQEINQEEKEKEKETKIDEQEDDDLNAEIEDDVFELSDAERNKLIYGQDLFLDLNLGSYTKNNDVRPPPNYMLGEDDELIVNIFGDRSQFSGNFKIENGYIQPTMMERIFLKGLTFSQATQLLKKKFSKYYDFENNEIAVSLNYSRNIIVNITGMARKFGSYNIPATNTVFTALVAAKGPNEKGSVRNIKIHRSGSPSKNFDLYQYLLDPSIVEDFFLQNNDYVHIPTISRVVSIGGAVLRPHKYELKENENLKQLLFWAGGLSENAYQKNIRIIRYVDDKERIITVNYRDLAKSGKDFKLLNGDQVDIPVIPIGYKNYVSIEGSVDLPGEYQLYDGMKISDLILQGTPSDIAKLDEGFLFRITKGSETEPISINFNEILKNPNSPANLKLLPKDRIIVFTENEFMYSGPIVLKGAVRNPNNYPYSKNLKLSDIITLSGGLKEDATGLAYIYRTKLNSLEPTEYIRVDISNAISNKNSLDNILLEPKDSVIVYSYSELLEAPSTVMIKGAVLNQDTFSYSSNMTLRDLILLSGGLKLAADQAKVQVYRVNIKSGESTVTQEIPIELDNNYNVLGAQDGEFYLNPFDIVEVRYTPDFELQQSVIINGEVKYPGSYSLIKPNEKLSDIIDRAGGFKKSAFKEGISLLRKEGGLGNLVVDVKDIMNDKNSPSNYILREGDVITIPKQVNVVSIQGFTNASETYGNIDNPSEKVNVPFHEGKDAKYYIDKYAGGINKDSGGKYRLIKVKQPGGKLQKTKDYGFFKKYPEVQKGAVIIVDRKVKTEDEKEREKVDWGEVIANTVTQATAILTLVILIQQIQ